MKHFSAQYIFTNSGAPVKRGVVTTDDEGTILNIEETGGKLEERHSTEFHNGIIIPGFVNCHCHLELSHMNGVIKRGSGLGSFIEQVRKKRETDTSKIITAFQTADNEMSKEGIVLCADICNTSLTFNLKTESSIRYFNLLEVFGIDPDKATKRLVEIDKVAESASKSDLPFVLTPHSVYSMSLTLLKLLKERGKNNPVTSIHFMETPGEKTFLENHSGPVFTSFEKSGLIPQRLETVDNHYAAITKELTRSGNLILVHNTFIDRQTIRLVKTRDDLFWCLCPNSNIYIENEIPPVTLLMEEDCELVIGTDSLASNNKLSILEEIKTLQLNFPLLTIEELVRWATLNGARALGMVDTFGKIETGMKPGLLLLQNVDLINMKLLPESFVTRLI